MTTPRTALTTLALAGLAFAPTAALAASGQSAHYLPTMKPPATSPVAIHGSSPKAYVKTADKLHRGQALMPVKVSGPAHSGIQLRFTCPSGAVTGYGYKGADGLAVNGRRIFGQHTVRPKVQASADRNHDGRFTGTVYAFCEGGHK